MGAWATVSVSRVWVRWTLAEAFEQAGHPDSAAVYLERILSDDWSTQPVGWESPYVHRRLALLDARMGRIQDAERHLATVVRAWDRPAPAIRRQLDDARAAVSTARGTTAARD